MDEEELLWLEESRSEWADRKTFGEFAPRPQVSLSVVSLDEDENDDEGIEFPSYDDVLIAENEDTNNEPLGPETEPKGHTDEHRVDATTDLRSTFLTPDLIDTIDRSVDDIDVRFEPSGHVDYLAHDWDEEDIWSSWGHVRSKRKECENSERLENAAWRSWEKKRSNLKTVSPEKLNWMKDCDTTWLYGPLRTSSHTPRPRLKKPYPNYASSLDIKPILKKRRVSDMILHRSPSPFFTLEGESEEFSAPSMSRSSSVSSTSSMVSTSFKKVVRFHDLVEQFVAVDSPEEDEDSYVLLRRGNYSKAFSNRRDTARTTKRPMAEPKPCKDFPGNATPIVAKLACTKLQTAHDIGPLPKTNTDLNIPMQYEQFIRPTFEIEEYLQAERDGDLEWEYSMIGIDFVPLRSIDVR